MFLYPALWGCAIETHDRVLVWAFQRLTENISIWATLLAAYCFQYLHSYPMKYWCLWNSCSVLVWIWEKKKTWPRILEEPSNIQVQSKTRIVDNSLRSECKRYTLHTSSTYCEIRLSGLIKRLMGGTVVWWLALTVA